MREYLAIENKKLDSSVYETERDEVLQTWHTGRGVVKKGLLASHRHMADTKKFSVALTNAEKLIGKPFCSPAPEVRCFANISSF